MSSEERQITIKTARSVLDTNGFKDVKIIAGTGASSRRETLQLSKEAKEAGADFALVLPTNYWPGAMTTPVLVEFFRTLADASELPILLYNFPMVASGINLSSDTILELAAHPKIVGVKLTCGVSRDGQKMQRLT